MQSYYPPNTYIKCVMVGGEGHGKSYLKTPADAHGFKLAIPRPLPITFTLSDQVLESPMPEVIRYDPFVEISFRGHNPEFQFIRLFAESKSYVAPGASILQIADALRIAKIDSL